MWFVDFSGQETLATKMFLSKTTVHDYENLCSLNLLGITYEHLNRDKKNVNNFKSNFNLMLKGVTKHLIWKEKHILLKNNRSGSLGRLNNVLCTIQVLIITLKFTILLENSRKQE